MERKGDWAQTFTGKQFWPLDPQTEDINIKDIAHGLSNQCRFNGHSKEFYSVAQHCILVSKITKSDQSLAALLHDASEAYIGDIVSPLKRFLPKEFKEIEVKIEEIINKKFNITNIDHNHIKNADKIALVTEMRDVMGPPPKKWNEEGFFTPHSEKIIPLSPKEAEKEFLNRFYELTK